jgi:hypothetical protein
MRSKQKGFILYELFAVLGIMLAAISAIGTIIILAHYAIKFW